MMARTHIAVGAGLALLASGQGAFGPGLAGITAATLAAGVGSLAPDIDHPKSVVGRMIPAVSIPLSAVFGHRGITHSLLAVGLCVWGGVWAQETLPPSGVLGSALLGFLLGYLSHLLADAFNPSGVPLLYPSRKRFRLPITVPTGGVLESLLLAAFVAISVLSVLVRLSPSA